LAPLKTPNQIKHTNNNNNNNNNKYKEFWGGCAMPKANKIKDQKNIKKEVKETKIRQFKAILKQVIS